MIALLRRKIHSFMRIPWREKCWFFILFFLFGLIRGSLLMLPFRWLAPLLGLHHQNCELASLVSEEQRLLAWRIGSVTQWAADFTPWESKCLVQAMAARLLLGWYGIPYVLYLGVCKPSGENLETMKAHAWLAVGSWVITGRDGHRAFTIVSTFVAPVILHPVGMPHHSSDAH